MKEKWFLNSKLLLLGILLLAAFFRFYDLNWDQNQHLHPDERFLTMVGIDMRMPPNLATYLDPQISTFNPTNIGHTFFVYGTFPIVLNVLIGLLANTNDYNNFTLMGRMLSGFMDILVVFTLFKTAELFEKKYKFSSQVKYWTAFFYAIAVLPIQLSHFFAVDTFLNSFIFLSFYGALRFSFFKRDRWLFFSSIFFGLALASKITAILVLPLLLFFFVNAYTLHKKILSKDLLRLLGTVLLFGMISYLVLRISDPYLFQNGNLFDPHPNKIFLENLKQLEAWSSPTAWYPPGVQWIHKIPILFALKNLVLFGTGIGFIICLLLGIFYLIRKFRHTELLVIFGWVVLLFLYQSMQITQTMRYFLIIYPFLALISGIGFTYFYQQTNKILSSILFFFIVIWTLLFFSIYTKPITRVTASHWIYLSIPQKSVILTESWDDALPLSLATLPSSNYNIQELPIFDPDTPQKWDKMHTLLSQGDYLILSSNRGWGSIPTVPERYPLMTRFYHDLFAGKTSYQKIAEFTSYPSLSYVGIPLTIPDDSAEEAFTVYDHPKVIIFKHIR